MKGGWVLFFKVIACEVACWEICFVVAQSQNTVDLEFLPVGYHDDPRSGKGTLQRCNEENPA